MQYHYVISIFDGYFVVFIFFNKYAVHFNDKHFKGKFLYLQQLIDSENIAFNNFFFVIEYYFHFLSISMNLVFIIPKKNFEHSIGLHISHNANAGS